jgi:hypothetical protein
MAKLTLSRKGQLLNTFFLTGTEWLVGSNPASTIRIETPSILPNHARITRNAGEYRIAAVADDLEIRVNHSHAREHILRDGDIIYVGGFTLTFSADVMGAREHAPPVPGRAWLQVLNGTHQGRTIQLQNPVTRFGSAGDLTVMISRRTDGYYLSHLEGDEFPLVNQTVINDTTWPLNRGDTIHMGKLRFGFCAEYAQAAAAGEPSDKGQRHFTRVSLHSPAIVATQDNEWDTHLMDLSLSGALLAQPSGWTGKTGDRIRLKLLLADQPCLEVQGQVRQVDADRLGISFVDLDDSHRNEIRWLVEINLGDPVLLQREFSEFL